jgi:hypothetical protein
MKGVQFGLRKRRRDAILQPADGAKAEDGPGIRANRVKASGISEITTGMRTWKLSVASAIARSCPNPNRTSMLPAVSNFDAVFGWMIPNYFRFLQAEVRAGRLCFESGG